MSTALKLALLLLLAAQPIGVAATISMKKPEAFLIVLTNAVKKIARDSRGCSMSGITLELLVDTIRSAESLDDLYDLKRMVGATSNEYEQSEQRLQQIERLWKEAERNGWGCTPSNWPWPHNEHFKRIDEAQRLFENKYC